MNKCNNTKLMQIYLDGWMSESEIKKFESHLKDCPDCQLELVDQEEITRSALEIIDQAPERDYWDNFINRVNNRIAARDIGLETASVRKSKPFSLKYSFYSVAIMAVAASLLIIFNTGIHKIQSSGKNTTSDIYSPVSGKLPLMASGINNSLSPNYSQSNEIQKTLNIPVDDNSKSMISKIAGNLDFSDETSTPGVNPQMAMALNAPGNALNMIKEPSSFFRGKSIITHASVILSDISSLDMQSRPFSDDRLDSSFKLRLSVIADRMLSNLGNSSQWPYNVGSVLLNQDYTYADLNGGKANVSDAINTRWGYLRMPTDDTKPADARKYLIELELMQNK